MTIADIINEVQLAIDEENVASGAHISTTLSKSLEQGVRSAAKHALRWLALSAPPILLDGSDENTDPGFIVTSNPPVSDRSITLQTHFTRLMRVRAGSWHRAISDFILDTSEEYLALSDETATATADRPVAALVLDNPKRLELWPYENDDVVTLTICQLPLPSLSALDSDVLTTLVPIPPKVRMAFVYYTAYLLLLSYRDPSASAFRDAAINALGLNQK